MLDNTKWTTDAMRHRLCLYGIPPGDLTNIEVVVVSSLLWNLPLVVPDAMAVTQSERLQHALYALAKIKKDANALCDPIAVLTGHINVLSRTIRQETGQAADVVRPYARRTRKALLANAEVNSLLTLLERIVIHGASENDIEEFMIEQGYWEK